jgi:hypothetical protein
MTNNVQSQKTSGLFFLPFNILSQAIEGYLGKQEEEQNRFF